MHIFQDCQAGKVLESELRKLGISTGTFLKDIYDDTFIF